MVIASAIQLVGSYHQGSDGLSRIYAPWAGKNVRGMEADVPCLQHQTDGNPPPQSPDIHWIHNSRTDSPLKTE